MIRDEQVIRYMKLRTKGTSQEQAIRETYSAQKTLPIADASAQA